MKETTKKWLPFAKADIETATILLSSKTKSRWTNMLILWHCQQAIEKMFKAIMIEKDKELLQVHNLRRLREIADVELSDDDFSLIIEINQYYSQSRYPDLTYSPMSNPSNQLALKLFQKTNILYLWLIKYLEKL